MSEGLASRTLVRRRPIPLLAFALLIACAAAGVSGAFGPAAIAATPEPALPDYSDWQRLLDERLLPLRVFDTDRTAHIASSLFDYAGVRADSAWSKRLDRIRQELLGIAPSRL